MSDLNQVVELDAPADHRRIGLGAVDAGVGPDLYVVFDHHVAQLRNFVETARGVGHEAETVGADHGSRVQDAVAADPAAFVYLDSGVEDRAFAHRNPRSEVNLRIDLAVFADFHARFDHREIPDVAVGAHLGLFSDRSQLADAAAAGLGGVVHFEQFEHAGGGVVHLDERGRDLLRRFERTVYQHDRCARAVEERFVFGVGEVGQRARLALLDRRYGVYFRLFVADDVAA